MYDYFITQDLAPLGSTVATVSHVTQSVITYLIITYSYDSNMKVRPWAHLPEWPKEKENYIGGINQ